MVCIPCRAIKSFILQTEHCIKPIHKTDSQLKLHGSYILKRSELGASAAILLPNFVFSSLELLVGKEEGTQDNNARRAGNKCTVWWTVLLYYCFHQEMFSTPPGELNSLNR